MNSKTTKSILIILKNLKEKILITDPNSNTVTSQLDCFIKKMEQNNSLLRKEQTELDDLISQISNTYIDLIKKNLPSLPSDLKFGKDV